VNGEQAGMSRTATAKTRAAPISPSSWKRTFLDPTMERQGSSGCQAILCPALFREYRSLVVGSPALVVEGRLQKKDGNLSIRTERFERMDLDEPIPELRRTASPPYPRNRESTPPSHAFR